VAPPIKILLLFLRINEHTANYWWSQMHCGLPNRNLGEGHVAHPARPTLQRPRIVRYFCGGALVTSGVDSPASGMAMTGTIMELSGLGHQKQPRCMLGRRCTRMMDGGGVRTNATTKTSHYIARQTHGTGTDIHCLQTCKELNNDSQLQ